MQVGSESWKWALVVILLAVFIVVANQAYRQITSQEDFAPPDDYLKGDSWDIEHGLAADPALPGTEINELSDNEPAKAQSAANKDDFAYEGANKAAEEAEINAAAEANEAREAKAAAETEAAAEANTAAETEANAEVEAPGEAIDWGDIKSPKKE